MTRRLLCLLCLLSVVTALAGTRITSRGNAPLQVPDAYAGELRQLAGGMTQIGAYQYFTFEYTSVDAQGRPDTLSSLAVLPYKSSTKEEPDPRNLVIACHATITNNDACPTRQTAAEEFGDARMMMFHAASTYDKPESGNLVIMPDYAGYGISADRPHPYLSETLTARNIVDAVFAGLELFLTDTKADGTPRRFASDNWRSVAVGYSQGGASAMAVHRFIETNHLVDSLHFQGSVCGDGPYDPIETIRSYIADDRIFLPVTVPLMMQGMLDANPLLRHRSPADYYTPEFIATGILDTLATKRYTTGEINSMLCAWAEAHPDGFQMYDANGIALGAGGSRNGTYARLADMLLPDVVAYFTNDDALATLPGERSPIADLHRALEHNNLTVGWQPACRMAVYHSVGDEVVPYVNAQSALNRLGSNVKHVRYEDTEAKMKHVSVGISFFTGMLFGTNGPLNLAFRAVMGTDAQWEAYGNDTWSAPRLAPANASQVFTADIDGTPVTFTLDGEGHALAGNGYTACVSQYTGGAVTLPATVENNGSVYPVAGTADWAFHLCDAITDLALDNGISRVGTMAASGCTSLATVALPGSVNAIASGAFIDCDALTDVTIDNPDPNVQEAPDAFERGNTAATLHVPAGSRDSFIACDNPAPGVWTTWFSLITESDEPHTAVNTITSPTQPARYTNILGQSSPTPWRGINIVNGTKILRK